MRHVIRLPLCLMVAGTALAHNPKFSLKSGAPHRPVHRSVLGPSVAVETYAVDGGEGALLMGFNWAYSESSTAMFADLFAPRLGLGVEGGAQIDTWHPLLRAHTSFGLGDGDLRGPALSLEGSVVTETLKTFGYGGALSVAFPSLGDAGLWQEHLSLRIGVEHRPFGDRTDTVLLLGLRCSFGRLHKHVATRGAAQKAATGPSELTNSR